MIVAPHTMSVWIVRGTVQRPVDYGTQSLGTFNVSSTCIARTAEVAINLHRAQHGPTSTIDSVVRGQRTDTILQEGEQ